MAKYRLKPLWAKIFGIALAVILVFSVGGAIGVCCAPWKWLAIPGLAGVTFFAFKPAFEFINGLVTRE